jgi:hypothetical protein
MIARCTNPKHKNFVDYGARGIRVCDSWLHSFTAFLADLGPKPTALHTLDRTDVNGNYEPSNCRWATRAEQSRNQRRLHPVTIGDKSMLAEDWLRTAGLCRSSFYRRVRAGQSREQVIGEMLTEKAARAARKLTR